MLPKSASFHYSALIVDDYSCEYPVLYYQSRCFAISCHYQYTVTLLLTSNQVEHLIGKTARLLSGNQVRVGVITLVETTGKIIDDHWVAMLLLVSALYRLWRDAYSQVFCDSDLSEVLTDIFLKCKYSTSEFVIALKFDLKIPYLLHIKKPPWQLFFFLVNRFGLLVFIDQQTGVVYVCDTAHLLTDKAGEKTIDFNLDMSRSSSFYQQLAVSPSKIKVFCPGKKKTEFIQTEQCIGGVGQYDYLLPINVNHTFITRCFDNLCAAKKIAASHYILESNLMLQLGQRVLIKNHPISQYNGAYWVIKLIECYDCSYALRDQQQVDMSDFTEVLINHSNPVFIIDDLTELKREGYYARYQLLALKQSFGLFVDDVTLSNHLLNAKVVKVSEQSCLDQRGYYGVIFDFENQQHINQRRNCLLPLLQPFSAQQSESPVGLSCSLELSSNILITCLYDDCFQPFIIGCLQDAQLVSSSFYDAEKTSVMINKAASFSFIKGQSKSSMKLASHDQQHGLSISSDEQRTKLLLTSSASFDCQVGHQLTINVNAYLKYKLHRFTISGSTSLYWFAHKSFKFTVDQTYQVIAKKQFFVASKHKGIHVKAKTIEINVEKMASYAIQGNVVVDADRSVAINLPAGSYSHQVNQQLTLSTITHSIKLGAQGISFSGPVSLIAPMIQKNKP